MCGAAYSNSAAAMLGNEKCRCSFRDHIGVG